MAARYSLAQWAHLRWTRMLLGRGAGNPLLRGGRGFRPVRGCRNHMNDLVAAAFELVENFVARPRPAGCGFICAMNGPTQARGRRRSSIDTRPIAGASIRERIWPRSMASCRPTAIRASGRSTKQVDVLDVQPAAAAREQIAAAVFEWQLG